LRTGLEGRRAHALLITASSEEALRRARQLCDEHLAHVRADYARWVSRQNIHAHHHAAPRRAREQAAAGGGQGGRATTASLADFIKPAKPKRQ